MDVVNAGRTPATANACDVLIIGGGPAGSTAAALLAQQGRRVIVLEKAHHPRFHIGESLLPLNLPLFDRLGVRDEIDRVSIRKYGVEFNSPAHPAPVTLEFAEAWDPGFPHAYQVRRSEFDHILLRNAVRCGADVREGVRATQVRFGDDRRVVVGARTDDGATIEIDARFLIDASGRDTVLATQFGWKRRNPRHDSAALFGHFEGARRLSGRAEGHISIFWFEHGWFWFIPLADGMTSIGAVCGSRYLRSRTKDVETFFRDTIALCPQLVERLDGARLVAPPTATGNYSYDSSRASGRNYLMLGDAFAFIDPVFSSGVFLAMNSAFVGADVVATCLDRPAEADAALRRFDRTMTRGPRVFSWFIYRVTTPAMRELFMHPRNLFGVKAAVLSVLAGDIFRGTPIGSRLLLFRAIYYAGCVLDFRRTWVAWRRRRRRLHEAAQTSGAV